MSAAASRRMRLRCLGVRSGRHSVRGTAAWLVLCACAGTTPGTDVPEKARPDAEERPPRVPSAQPWSFASSVQERSQTLDNGLSLRALERAAVPLVELRLVIGSGTGSDADRPGVAALTLEALARMVELSTGGELAARAELLGGQISLQARRDACVLALTLPSSALNAGFELLAALAVPPSWAPAAFEAARARELERLRSLGERPVWLAEQALYAELFRTAPRQHPYAHADTLPSELERLTLEDSKAWYERHFSPRNATLLVVGDIRWPQLQPLVQRSFGSWQGPEVAPLALSAPPAPARPKTLLVHRAGATRSELRIAVLGPARADAGWPAFAATQQLLGGDDSSRLRRELTRRGELDVELRAVLVPVARGATPLVIAAATSTERTGLALAALLDSIALLGSEPPAPRELHAAREQLAASALLDLDTSSGAAERLLQDQLWRLPGSAHDELPRRLAQLKPSDVQRSARRHLRAPPVVVVVGDAERLLTPLSRFGQVHLLDPKRDFQTERVVSQDPTAALEGPGSAAPARTEPPSRP